MDDEMTEKETTHTADGSCSLLAAEKTELDRRLTEDNTMPDDTVAWETIKTEAQLRWQR